MQGFEDPLSNTQEH
jgi:hypothetical protein